MHLFFFKIYLFYVYEYMCSFLQTHQISLRMIVNHHVVAGIWAVSALNCWAIISSPQTGYVAKDNLESVLLPSPPTFWDGRVRPPWLAYPAPFVETSSPLRLSLHRPHIATENRISPASAIFYLHPSEACKPYLSSTASNGFDTHHLAQHTCT